MTDKNEVLDIADFFSRENEENGIWYEAKHNGIPTGIEVKVYGPNSRAVAIADEKFQKERDAVDSIENPEERAIKFDEIVAKRFAGYISDIRGKNGRKLMLADREITKADIFMIIHNSPVLALDISRFAMNQENFLGHKEN